MILFDRNNVKAMRPELEAALAAIGEKYGAKVSIPSMRYDAASVVATVKIEKTNAAGENLASKRAFETGAWMYGLRREDYGRVFVSATGTEMQVIGLKPKARRFPILVRRTSDGKFFKMTASAVKAALAEETSARAIEALSNGKEG